MIEVNLEKNILSHDMHYVLFSYFRQQLNAVVFAGFFWEDETCNKSDIGTTAVLTQNKTEFIL